MTAVCTWVWVIVLFKVANSIDGAVIEGRDGTE